MTNYHCVTTREAELLAGGFVPSTFDMELVSDE